MYFPHHGAEELRVLVVMKQSDAFPGRAMGILGIENWFLLFNLHGLNEEASAAVKGPLGL